MLPRTAVQGGLDPSDASPELLDRAEPLDKLPDLFHEPRRGAIVGKDVLVEGTNRIKGDSLSLVVALDRGGEALADRDVREARLFRVLIPQRQWQPDAP